MTGKGKSLVPQLQPAAAEIHHVGPTVTVTEHVGVERVDDELALLLIAHEFRMTKDAQVVRNPRQVRRQKLREFADIFRSLLQTLNDHAAGKPLPGMRPESYRVRSGRFEEPKAVPFVEAMERHVRRDSPIAAE